MNGQNILPIDFIVKTTAIQNYPEKQFDSRAVDSLNRMLEDADGAGYKTHVVSAYRSVSYQQGLFERKTDKYLAEGMTQEQAEQKAGTWVARPGASEHNLGLAVDIVSGDWYTYNNDLTAEFENTELFGWLEENAHKYGFILRYPEGKTEITGIEYEPWHYRYVGTEHATAITEQGICLEEYLRFSPSWG